MKLCRFVSVCLLSLLLLGLIGNCLSQIKASSTLEVTEGSDYVTVENNYFIANMTEGGGGGIYDFYIKPHTDVNIVCHSGWHVLGGHEVVSEEVGYSGTCAQWTGGVIESVDISIVYQTSSVVTVRSLTTWNRTLYANTIDLTLISYKTFYADKPYYVSTDTRIVPRNDTQLYNQEICFLLDTDNYWSVNDDTDSYWFLNRTGYAERGDASLSPAKATGYVPLIEARQYQKFPWFWVLNETLENGYGTIFIDAKPWSYTAGIGGLAGGGAGIYTEYQICYPKAYVVEQPIVYTYISVVQTSTSPSYIDNLSSQLYASNETSIMKVNTPFSINHKHSTNGHNNFGRNVGWAACPNTVASYYWGGFQKAYGSVSNCINQRYVSNDTDTYANIWTWADIELTDYILTDTYAMVNYTQPWGQLNLTTTMEAWNNSDTMRVTYLLKAVAATNITYACVRQFSGGGCHHWSQLDTDYVKCNYTEIEGTIAEEAYIIKNMTNNPRSISGAYVYYNWVDNDAQQEYAAGTVWNITLYVQYFRRYEWQNLDYFSISDFHEPNEGETWLRDNLNYVYWLPAPLFNQESGLRLLGIADNSSGFYAVVDSSFANDKLTLVSVGETGSEATLQVYCGDKGEPTTVSGATSWSYNGETKIVTINVLHTGSKEIKVYFAEYTPPTTTISLSGTLGNNDWFISEVTVALSATDDISGVEKTEYSFNNTTWTTYAVPFNITNEGTTIIYYKSTDKVNNVETIKTETIKIDKTVPFGSIIINNGDAYTTSTSVTLTLTATDATSGIYQAIYSNDGVWDTELWEDFSTNKPWTLTTGDGTKTVYVQFKDNAGLISFHNDSIILDTKKPTANAGGDQTIAEDTEVTFDGSASWDENGISSYAWVFTDITPLVLSGKNLTYTFNTPGVYAIALNVTDAAGNWETDIVVITVLDITNPLANAGQNQTVNVGVTVTFDAGRSSDNVGIVSYEWDFGDGTTGTGITTTHTYASPGTYTVTLTVKDATGNPATHSITVEVLKAEAPSPPLWVMGAAAATIAIAVVLTLLWRKRKK